MDILKKNGLFSMKPKDLKLPLIVLIISGCLVSILMIAFLTTYSKGVGIAAVHAINNKERFATARINKQEIKIEIASTFRQQYQGLSGRDSICADCGMLFDFDDSAIQSFVMRNMKFPLDIIFIHNGVIVNIASNLEPEGANPSNIYKSDSPVNQVMEVNGGYCKRHNIKPGDKVSVVEQGVIK